MRYTRNDKIYSNTQLKRMGVTDPLSQGFSKLIDVRPATDRTTKAVQVGVKDGAVVYEVVQLNEQELVVALEKEKETIRKKRASEYPPVEDYVDGIVKGDDIQVQAYIDACLKVKEDNPFPTEDDKVI